tara:strand:- start:20822 stop:21895 length:1074 start_codon:yes stop_codon:yes gene_type:complete
MSNWVEIAGRYDAPQHGPAVLITVGTVRGSTPRETGATMLVTQNHCFGTIGGGNLEYQAISKARKLLQSPDEAMLLRLPLGPELGQCCGGHVELLIDRPDDQILNDIFNRFNKNNTECVLLSQWDGRKVSRRIIDVADSLALLDAPLRLAATRRLINTGAEIIRPAGDGVPDTDGFTLLQSLSDAEFHVTLFGAGHVGKALISALSPLSCKINWVDQRASEFPARLPPNVTRFITDSPESVIAKSPARGYFLIMTHSHQLDLEICEMLLASRPEANFIGLIGSQTKRSRFEKRLAVRGFQASEISRITCPIGLAELEGKRPAEIALGVAADLLRRHQADIKNNAENCDERRYGLIGK